MGPENKENSVQESEELDESLLTDLHPHKIHSAPGSGRSCGAISSGFRS